MTRDLTYHISGADVGMKIEEYLKQLGCSHHVLTHLKRTEHGIVLNGAWAYASQRLSEGDLLQLHITEEACSEQIVPVRLPLRIVYEDADLMVIDKPADMPIHPSVNNHDNTLANAVMYYFSEQNLPFVYRCVNRLDRDTSGLLILAKNLFSASILYQMSARREIHRHYLAIVEGETPPFGTIDAPIARKADSAIMRCVDAMHGDLAITHYEQLAFYPGSEAPQIPPCGFSLLRIRLETGRTHQIRVHFSHLGYPLAGDFLYNPDSPARITRQALHSCSLDFCHPVTGEPLHFESPMPEDMNQLIETEGFQA